jgi:hypothetical protein
VHDTAAGEGRRIASHSGRDRDCGAGEVCSPSAATHAHPKSVLHRSTRPGCAPDVWTSLHGEGPLGVLCGQGREYGAHGQYYDRTQGSRNNTAQSIHGCASEGVRWGGVGEEG